MRPCVFVSKIELRRTPVFGWISMMAGTQYVERGAGGSAERAAQGMAKGFRDGIPIVFFPEGTTGTGDPVLLPFRSGLLAQTLEAGQPLTAAFIHYDVSDEDLASGYIPRKDIHWGKESLPAHLWKQCGIKKTNIHVRFAAEPIAFSEAALANRKIAAREAQAAVMALSVPMQGDVGTP